MTNSIDSTELSKQIVAMRKHKDSMEELFELLESKQALPDCLDVGQYRTFYEAYVIALLERYVSDINEREPMLASFQLLEDYDRLKAIRDRRMRYSERAVDTNELISKGWTDPNDSLEDIEDKAIEKLVNKLMSNILDDEKKQKPLGLADTVIEQLKTQFPNGIPRKLPLPKPRYKKQNTTSMQKVKTDDFIEDEPSEAPPQKPDVAGNNASSQSNVFPSSEPKPDSRIHSFIDAKPIQKTKISKRGIFFKNNTVNINGYHFGCLSLAALVVFAVFCWCWYHPPASTSGENASPTPLVPQQVIQIENVIVCDGAVERVLEYISSDPNLATVSQDGLLMVQAGQPGETVRTVDVTMHGENGTTETKTYTIDFSQEGFDQIEGDLNDYVPNFRVEQRVRLAGTDEWKTNIEDAKVGDKIEFRIRYTNISDEVQNSVMIKNVLPKNLAYIPSTTKLTNASYAADINQNDLVTDGVNIGSYKPGANAFVDFTAVVVDNTLKDGPNNIVNWSQCGVGQVTLQDYTTLQVHKGEWEQLVSE